MKTESQPVKGANLETDFKSKKKPIAALKHRTPGAVDGKVPVEGLRRIFPFPQEGIAVAPLKTPPALAGGKGSCCPGGIGGIYGGRGYGWTSRAQSFRFLLQLFHQKVKGGIIRVKPEAV